MKDFLISLKMILVLTFVTGVLYPGLLSVYALLFANEQAHGNILRKNEQIIGSRLLAQKFTRAEYFWSRPSAIDYNPSSSGASNQGPTSEALKKHVEERASILKAAHPESQVKIPQDLLFASGSGLDPHISPEAALFQSARVAKARNLEIADIRGLVAQMTEKPQWGILGEPRVNVLRLNLALDQIK